MSSLASTYALAAGVPLAKPEIQDAFYPLEHPLDKTILVHAFAGAITEHNGQKHAAFPAKIYDHFAEVVGLLSPIVTPLGYRFVQIGGANEPPLKGAEYLCGKTSLHQCAYLAKRAALLIGNDSMWVHVRGAYGKPLVAVYGSTDVKNHGPHWNDPKVTRLIESHRAGRKPSYSSQESPKTVNWIRPEQIVQAALDLLGISQSLTHQTYYIGPEYQNVTFEIVPNMVVPPQMNIGIPAIRMDYHFDEAFLAQNLSVRKCAIATDKEINVNLLAQLRPQIAGIRIEVDNLSTQWIKTVKRIGIPIQAVTRQSDPEKLAAKRLELFDVECFFDVITDPDVETLRKEVGVYLNKPLDTEFKVSTLSFKSHRFILSSGRIFLSESHWRAGISVESMEQNHGEVIDDPKFWADQRRHFYYTK